MYVDVFCSLLPDVNYNSKKNKSLTIQLTHSGRATQIFVSKLTIIGSGNSLSPGHRQAIVWTNAGIVLMWPLGTNFSEILIEIITFLIKEMHFKVSSAKRRPFCLGLNVFTLRVLKMGYSGRTPSKIQYIPRNMHTVFALLCFVVVIHWLIFPYPSGLLHWHCGNLTIAPMPAKQPWWIWINNSCEFIMNDCVTTTKHSTTKPCTYFLGYTVWLLMWQQMDVTSHDNHAE